MKRKIRNNKVDWRVFPVSALSAVLLIPGCGGGNSADPVDTNSRTTLNDGSGEIIETDVTSNIDTTVTISGRVLNVGYVANANVCADLNDNGLCDTDEPSAITNAEGQYNLSLPTGHRGTNLLAVITPESQDTAGTPQMPVQFHHGWIIPTALEYPPGVTEFTQNITSVSMVNYARLRSRGRGRSSNEFNTLIRVVGEPILNPVTGEALLTVDFDYVADPKNQLAERLYRFSQFLDNKSMQLGTSLDLLTVTAYGLAMYGATEDASADEPQKPSDPAVLIKEEADGEDIVGDFLAEDHANFRPNTDIVTHLRNGLTETTGWGREPGTGNLVNAGRRALFLRNGAVVSEFATLDNGTWNNITVNEEPTFTIDPTGNLATIEGTGSQLPRAISGIDGNHVSIRMPGNQSRLSYDISISPGTNFFIEEWVDEQQSYDVYYNEAPPLNEPFTSLPACAVNYPGYVHQPNIGDSISGWYTGCFDYFTAVYYSEVMGDPGLTYMDPDLPGATFYDLTVQDPIAIFPATQECGGDNAIPNVTTNGIKHCNWAVDAQSGHSVEDLFVAEGVQIHSWTHVYGISEFDVDDAPVIVSGTPEQAGQPQQLTLTLNRNGNETSGTGTLYSTYGGWVSSHYTPLTETINWSISESNPNLVLVEFPFLDVDNPLVPEDRASDGSPAQEPSVFSGARTSTRERSEHFSATWNNTTFRMDQSTHTSANKEKIAILLNEGQFIVGQYYDAGFTFSERYFTTPGMDKGFTALQFILEKLYEAGFTDDNAQTPTTPEPSPEPAPEP